MFLSSKTCDKYIFICHCFISLKPELTTEWRLPFSNSSLSLSLSLSSFSYFFLLLFISFYLSSSSFFSRKKDKKERKNEKEERGRREKRRKRERKKWFVHITSIEVNEWEWDRIKNEDFLKEQKNSSSWEMEENPDRKKTNGRKLLVRRKHVSSLSLSFSISFSFFSLEERERERRNRGQVDLLLWKEERLRVAGCNFFSLSFLSLSLRFPGQVGYLPAIPFHYFYLAFWCYHSIFHSFSFSLLSFFLSLSCSFTFFSLTYFFLSLGIWVWVRKKRGEGMMKNRGWKEGRKKMCLKKVDWKREREDEKKIRSLSFWSFSLSLCRKTKERARKKRKSERKRERIEKRDQ